MEGETRTERRAGSEKKMWNLVVGKLNSFLRRSCSLLKVAANGLAQK